MKTGLHYLQHRARTSSSVTADSWLFVCTHCWPSEEAASSISTISPTAESPYAPHTLWRVLDTLSVWKWVHMRGMWQADGFKTYLRKRVHNRMFPGLVLAMAWGPAHCSPSASSDGLFSDFKSAHPPKADTELTLEVWGLLYHACPLPLWGLTLCWGISRTCYLFSGNLWSLCFDLTERNESTASFFINIMPWTGIQQWTRQTRFLGAPGPRTVPGYIRPVIFIEKIHGWWLGWWSRSRAMLWVFALADSITSVHSSI